MTKEELKKHCEKQVKACEMWAENRGQEPSGKVYEEHKLILELINALEQQSSDDCVSREQAIKAMTDWYIDMLENREGKDFINVLDSLPPVTPTQSWIPVSERLPKVGEKVLCQCQANIFEVLKLMVDGWYHDENHCYMSGFVIAWQPLPEPYEEKRGNENE